MTVLESKIETYLCEQAQMCGGFVAKFVDPSRRGAPDRILFLPWGAVYFVELKRPKGKTKVHQDNYHKLMRDAGTNVYVLDTFKAVESFFRMVGM
jgi:hypothetical protein